MSSLDFFYRIMQYLKKIDNKIYKIEEEIKTLTEEIGNGMRGKGKKRECSCFSQNKNHQVSF